MEQGGTQLGRVYGCRGPDTEVGSRARTETRTTEDLWGVPKGPIEVEETRYYGDSQNEEGEPARTEASGCFIKKDGHREWT